MVQRSRESASRCTWPAASMSRARARNCSGREWRFAGGCPVMALAVTTLSGTVDEWPHPKSGRCSATRAVISGELLGKSLAILRDLASRAACPAEARREQGVFNWPATNCPPAPSQPGPSKTARPNGALNEYLPRFALGPRRWRRASLRAFHTPLWRSRHEPFTIGHGVKNGFSGARPNLNVLGSACLGACKPHLRAATANPIGEL
jgi:hypothetical protein